MNDDILNKLYENKTLVEELIKFFESNDIKQHKPDIVFSVFDLVECVCSVEILIYNYLKEI